MNIASNRIKAHLTGETRFIDDLDRPKGLLYGCVFKSPVACGRIEVINTVEAEKIKDVCAVLSYKDIPGKNSMGAVFDDEPILAEDYVEFAGQAILLVAAKSKDAAIEAVSKVVVKIEEMDPILDVYKSYETRNFPFEPLHIEKGDVEEGFAKSDYVIEGKLETGGQEHFYMETHGAMALPQPDGTFLIKASTQNPSENQYVVSHMLNIESSMIEVQADAIGGGFGGKETQSNWCAAWSSLLAYHCGQPVLIVFDRMEDMAMTGKRHPASVDYKVGFNRDGRINSYYSRFLFDTGFCADLSRSIMERCMLHLDNSYYIPAIKSDLYPCRTNRPSNTALRGFGAPQAIAVIENIMDEISGITGIDQTVVRRRNFYGKRVRNLTPYGQKVKENILEDLYRKIIESSSYRERLSYIRVHNRNERYKKRGIAMVPVKFGISFTTSFLNQGGALVNLYRDGSVTVHQGGVEMGQGLYDKMVSILSVEFGIPKNRIRVCSTNTAVIPNTSATAASTGSDINGHAIKLATDRLKRRLNDHASKKYGWNTNEIIWESGCIFSKNNPEIRYNLSDFLNEAYLSRVSLSEQAFYETPGLFFDRDSSRGNPFYYYVFGISTTEVEVDMLTGEHVILRTDILHDAGDSIDPVIDIGQIEGAFVQCSGWVTMEELVCSNRGILLTSGPESYKIPGIKDIPRDFRITLYDGNPFKGGIMNSRAVGEPPFIYGLSVWLAIKNALSYSITGSFRLDLPATKERILKCAYYYDGKNKK